MRAARSSRGPRPRRQRLKELTTVWSLVPDDVQGEDIVDGLLFGKHGARGRVATAGLWLNGAERRVDDPLRFKQALANARRNLIKAGVQIAAVERLGWECPAIADDLDATWTRMVTLRGSR